MLALVGTISIAQAETLRIATFNAELSRKGPGLLLRDIQRGKDPQISAFKQLLNEIRPDIIMLQGVNYDLRHTALDALARDLAAGGLAYPHIFASAPNAGQASGLDLNGNGKLGEADDAHGYGRLNSMGGMAILSRFPILNDAVEDYTPLLWRDLKEHIYPMVDNDPFGGPDVFAAHRLSSRGHWVVPVETPGFGTLRLMTFYATPPLYDGPEDRNGRRNHDEVAFWLEYLARDDSPLPLVLGGTANVDPLNGSGRPEAINALLAHPALQNPFDATPTADFGAASAGALRLDYLLPSAGWQIAAHGIVHSPTASRHSLMWVDIAPR
ncbi:MAG: endonuclease/exonuclease/phosphatase family protein [Sulfitobacter sp.]|nr:endonuclease/exonuclease/phosphatase family protein [Sulfitobacter sp.]